MNVSLSERSEREESLRVAGGAKILTGASDHEHRLKQAYILSDFEIVRTR